MVGDSAVNLVQPHLWAAERLVWCDRPTSLGAVVARIGYAYEKAAAVVGSFRGPLSLFEAVSRLLIIAPLLILFLWLPFALGVLGVAVALVAALAAGAYAWLRARTRGISYAISDRRVLAVRGSEVAWTLHEAWDDARVAWRLGSIGTVAFSRRGEGDLDVRFSGVRDPTAILELANRSALQRPQRQGSTR